MVEGGVLVGDFQGRTGAVDAGDVRAPRGEMESEPSLIAEDVESFAFGVLSGDGVVFALVEEGAGFLAFERVVAELDGIHGEGGGGFLTLQKARSARRKSFEFAHSRIDALDDGGWVQAVGQFREHRLAHGLRVHCLSKNLQGKNVAVAVNDEAGEKVGFGEDDPVSFGVADQGGAVGNGIADPLAQQGGKIRDGVVLDHADGNLRGGGVESGAEWFATVVGDADYGAGKGGVGRDDVGAVDPDVSVFQARGAAGGDLDGGMDRSSGLFWHAAILNAGVPMNCGPGRAALDWTAGGGCPHINLQEGLRSRKIICSAVLSRGALAKEPYSATGSRPASRNRA